MNPSRISPLEQPASGVKEPRGPSPSSDYGKEVKTDQYHPTRHTNGASDEGNEDLEKEDMNDDLARRQNGNVTAVGGSDGPIAGSPTAPPASGASKGPPMFDVPDGGLQAWLQVAGAFGIFFNTWFVVA